MQALCFLAGANSIFYGEKLLTTGNPDVARTARCSRAWESAAGAAGDARPRRASEAGEHEHGPGCSHALRLASQATHATRPGSAEEPRSTTSSNVTFGARGESASPRASSISAVTTTSGWREHPEVVRALQDAASKYGVGSGGSHLVAGHGPEHEALEQELAAFTGREKALVFSTGYMANMGVISALADQTATIVADKLNHASLIDGAG